MYTVNVKTYPPTPQNKQKMEMEVEGEERREGGLTVSRLRAPALTVSDTANSTNALILEMSTKSSQTFSWWLW